MSVLAVAALTSACPAGDGNLTFPKNHCTSDHDCSEGLVCLSDHNLCALPEAEVPYTVVLQASPRPYAQSGRYTFPGSMLGAGFDSTIPAFVDVHGSIQVDDKPIYAEVTFVPRPEKRGYPVAPISVRTTDSRGLPNLSVQLPSDTVFSVSIQPLGAASRLHPPRYVTFQTGSSSTPFAPDFTTELRSFALTLYEAEKPEGFVVRDGVPQTQRLRVINRVTGHVVSPTLDVMPGEPFVISVVEEDEAEYAFEIDLNPELPWTDLLELPFENLDNGALQLPYVPERVNFVGGVEDASDRRLPHAEITLISSFPVPSTPSELGNRDWCQFRASAVPNPNQPEKTVRCSAKRTLQADARGDFRVALLPGNYEIYISPGPGNGAARVATTRIEQGIETQPGGADLGPWTIKLKPATELTGSIVDRGLHPLPQVTVRAVPLGLVGTLGSVSAYNREVSALTDSDGAFAMSVDTGYYDIVAAPPAGSGYPTLLFANRQFDPDKMSFLDRQGLALPPPVVVAGTLLQAGEILADAEVRAYGIVRDLRGFDRAVLLYSASTDEEGRYVLLLPPALNDAPQAD